MRGAIFAIVVATALVLSPRAVGRNVTLSVSDRAAEPVFVEIMRQSGNNYVFPAGLLDGMTVSVRADNEPVERLLARMFEGTGIVCRIEGNNIILSRRTESAGRPMAPDSDGFAPETDVVVNSLAEVVVISSRNAYLDQNSSEIGARSLNRTEINGTPALFGENDVIKVLQTQPGVSGGTEGMASMYVHGGNDDENLFMLDNVPLYQVNHFGGLFSAFNTEAIRQVDFYKSSFPAKYDGRLSSYVDVRTRDGRTDRHSGSFRLGMTSGALSLEGPIGDRTSYSVALRRSWYEVLTIPMMAIVSSLDDSDMSMRYAFADLNGRVTHRFSDRSKVYASVYYGYDILNTTLKEDDDRYKTRMRWGNMVASAGWNYAMDRNLFGEFTAAYTRYFSHLGHDWLTVYGQSATDFTRDVIKSDNNIGDAIVKADFDWRPADSHKVAFGTSYTLHSFVPSSASRNVDSGGTVTAVTDSAKSYRAHEASLYIGDDWTVTDRVRVNAGVHASLFAIDGHVTSGVSPRLSIRWQVAPGWSLKGAYACAHQYVHRLTESYMSLPTDRWVPIDAKSRPQRSDKVSAGVYWMPSAAWSVSVEGFAKWMHNLVEYRDEYYLLPPQAILNARLTTGRGSARGIDLRVARNTGLLTGHISYSLLWADRTFADRNGGATYPARCDNRHKINVALQFRIGDRWRIGATWTGSSGNRITLPVQMWMSPSFDGISTEVPLRTSLNNYRLPFYHRLDLGVTRETRRGYWTISVFNTYCNMNVVAVTRGHDKNGKPVFKQVRMLPVIPSFSYTWIF